MTANYYIKFLQIFIILIISNIVVANNNVKTSDYYDLLEQYENEVKNLIERIERLEHKVDLLTKQSNSNIQHNKGITEDTNINTPQQLDIFQDALSKPDNNNSTDITKPQNKDDKAPYDIALASLKSAKFEDAENKFSEFINNYPESKLIGNAYFWYAETFFKRNMFDKATINYLKCYKQDAKGSKASDALLKVAISLNKLGNNSDACDVLNKLDSQFPNRPASAVNRAKELRTKINCKN